MAPDPSGKSRDPLGKRALFSTQTPTEPLTPNERPRQKGLFDLDVHCSNCGRTTTLGAREFAMQHFPLWAWAPWRKEAHFMRCPACDQLGWHSVRRAG